MKGAVKIEHFQLLIEKHTITKQRCIPKELDT